MAFFKVKVGDETYELERLTLGDARVLKRDFGLTDLEFFSPSDPDQMVGLLALAISKTKGISISEATAEAEALDIEAFEPQDTEDPTPAAEAAEDESASSGKSETRPKTTGRQR